MLLFLKFRLMKVNDRILNDKMNPMRILTRRMIVLLFSVVLFSSCASTCITCTVERLDGTIEAQYDEFCGTEEEIEDFKADIQQKISTTSGSSGWQLKCSEK